MIRVRLPHRGIRHERQRPVQTGRRERARAIAIGLSVTVILLDAGVLLGRGSVTRAGPPSPSAVQDAVPVAAPPAVPSSSASSAQVSASPPISVAIPSIGVTSDLVHLGLNADRTIQVPVSYGEAGWYDLGPSPGQTGPAVIVGHVDSKAGPGVFYRLGALAVGATIVVTLADHATATFAVSSVAEYPKDSFPTQLVYGALDYPALRLITCGGTFDSHTGHYLSNIVAFARLVSATPAR